MVKSVLFVAPPISVTTTSADEEDETDDLYGVAVRRCAVKQPKIFVVRGHKFIETFFKSPTFCSYCSEFLWLVLMLVLMIEILVFCCCCCLLLLFVLCCLNVTIGIQLLNKSSEIVGMADCSVVIAKNF